MIKLVILQWFRYESRYLLETFSICSSHVCAKLTTKFLLLLNQPASNGPFRPKLWMALATVFVGIFWKKFWSGSRPIPVANWKEFWIYWKKKWCFLIFFLPANSFLATEFVQNHKISIFVHSSGYDNNWIFAFSQPRLSCLYWVILVRYSSCNSVWWR